MEKASWKRKPGSAHVSGKMEGVSQALPEPRALRDFRTHCHHSSLSPLPSAILELFFPWALFNHCHFFFFFFSGAAEASKPYLYLPLLVMLALPWPTIMHHGALTPPQLTNTSSCLSSVSSSSHSVCPALHFHPSSYSHWHKLFFTFPLAK